MLTTPELGEYLAEIRSQVCTHCVERLPGAPPCEPLGKLCGVEQHLPELIDAIHSVHSEVLAPYRNASQLRICAHCSFRHSEVCPCPMDYLHVLIVQAVETVDARHELLAIGGNRAVRSDATTVVSPGLAEVRRLYEQGVGGWTGCDWPTKLGRLQLNLNGWTAAKTTEKVAEVEDSEKADWQNAADWLGKVEAAARNAESEAALAVRSAEAGDWLEALEHARAALASEFATGRAVRRGSPMTWHRLFLTVEAAVPSQPSQSKLERTASHR